MDAAGILGLVDAFDHPDSGFQSLMIARHGRVVAEGSWAPYRLDRVHLLYSVSKSFTATVVGMLCDQGVLGLDTPVWSYLVDDLDGVGERWRRVLVRHCLSMAVGHLVDAWTPEAWTGFDVPAVPFAGDPLLGFVRDQVPDAEPGTVWAYNQVATYLLAQAVHRVTGWPVSRHVQERLLVPFGHPELAAHRSPLGRDLGFSGLHVTTEAMLGLAQTYLDGGVFDGRRLLSPAWVAQACRPTPVSLRAPGEGDWGFGYGFSFWASSHGYRGDGAFGQFALVLPEQGLVVAITSEHDMQHTLDLVWEHLLPACSRPGGASADEDLRSRLAGLAIPALAGGGSRGAIMPVSPRGDVATGGDVSIVGVPGGFELGLGGSVPVTVGNGRWQESALVYQSGRLPVVASGGWAEGVFRAEVRVIETPHTIRVHADPVTGEAVVRWRNLPLSGADPEQLVAVR